MLRFELFSFFGRQILPSLLGIRPAGYLLGNEQDIAIGSFTDNKNFGHKRVH
jgi:hypothetical protein